MRAIVALAKDQPATIGEVADPELAGDDEVLIEVSHSSLNFKDGSAVVRGTFVQRWPLVLGIDTVGIVMDSASASFSTGDRVVLNGAGAGETRPGGYAKFTTAPATSLVRVPDSLELSQAAAIGTAGFTAALAVLAIEDQGARPADGDVLVTGAAGGVGSMAVALLAGRGYRVVASTGRAAKEGEYLTALGASQVIDRTELSEPNSAMLQPPRWSAVVDGVGSHTLANALAQTVYGGVAVSYGRLQAAELPVTVIPFILRAITLRGANSVDAPLQLRERAWRVLGSELDLAALDRMSSSIGLGDVLDFSERIVRGETRGRTVVDVTR